VRILDFGRNAFFTVRAEDGWMYEVSERKEHCQSNVSCPRIEEFRVAYWPPMLP
jgi:hypothetical protein